MSLIYKIKSKIIASRRKGFLPFFPLCLLLFSSSERGKKSLFSFFQAITLYNRGSEFVLFHGNFRQSFEAYRLHFRIMVLSELNKIYKITQETNHIEI